MQKLLLSLFFAISMFFSMGLNAMEPGSPEYQASERLLVRTFTFCAISILGKSINAEFDIKKSHYKKKYEETENILKTLQAIAAPQDGDRQKDLIARLPKKDRKALHKFGSTASRTNLMCRSRITYYQSQKEAFASAQSLIDKKKKHNSAFSLICPAIGFAILLVKSIVE